MSRFGGSRSIADQRVYVQETPPNDRRAGVRWFDTSMSEAVAHVYSVDHGDFMRESRVWVQDTEPDPRVGPLDGDKWVDTSQDKRPTMVFSAELNNWVDPVDISWSEVSQKPDSTGETSKSGGYSDWWTNQNGGSVTVEDITDSVDLFLDMDSGYEGAGTWTIHFTDGTTTEFYLSTSSGGRAEETHNFEASRVDTIEWSPEGGYLNGSSSEAGVRWHTFVIRPHDHSM